MGMPDTGAALECEGGGTPDGDANTAGKRTKAGGEDEEVRTVKHARCSKIDAVT